MMKNKFRFWDETRKEYRYDLVINSDGGTEDFNGNDWGDVIVEQWTGVKDEKGIDIFEGDIITDGEYERYPVEWNEDRNGWNIGYSLPSNYKVVGNIHKNS